MADYVISSGVRSGYTVRSGDTLTVLSGGISSNSDIRNGGVEIINSGAYARDDVISNGGIDIFDRGGTENGVTVLDGGVLELGNAVVRNGAYINLGTETSSDEFAGVTLESGASVWSLDALVGVSGAEYVSSGGVAYDTTVTSGGQMIVSEGGLAQGASIGHGGLLVDSGTLTGVISDAGEIVYNGAHASTLSGSLSGAGVLIDDQAAKVTVAADAASFTGQVQLQSGMLDLASAEGVGTAKIDFLGGDQIKTLRIEAADTPARGHTYGSPLDNFDASSDRLDLAGLRFTSGATATVSGSTLTLKDGAYTASFTLSGSISTDYVVTRDGGSGTVIHAKAGAATASLVQAAAAFGTPAAAPGASGPSIEGTRMVALAAPAAFHHAQA